MKRNMLSRVAMALFVTVLLVSALAMTAFATEASGCNHENAVDVDAVEATCTVPGKTAGRRCEDCGQVLEGLETIPAKGHTEVVDAGVIATCTEPGKTFGKHCSVCNEVLEEQTEVPSLGHSLEKVNAVEATCEEEGNIEYWRCNACKKLFADKEGTKELKKEETVVAAKGHTEVTDEAVPATCTEAGKTEGKHCSVCGEVLVEQEVVPASHTVVIDPPVAPTCTKTGLSEGSHCSVCGEILVEQKVVPASHIFDDGKVVSPTCCREGYTIYTCKACGIQVITDKVKPLSHWYAEWQPAGRHQNSAPCKRWGCTYTKTTACVDWDFELITTDAEGEEKVENYTVCPVCGQLSDGGRLELVEKAKATPVTAWTPEGDLVLRYGELEDGEKIISIGFEYDARLRQYYGICKFTVPAELLEGYQLMLLDEDGNETELEVKTSGSKASFTIDFHDETGKSWIPVQMLHLVPIEEPATEAVAG